MSSSSSRTEIRVYNLRQSALFYLHALHPLGYHYLGRQNKRVYFGTDDEDSFAVVKAKSGDPVGEGRIILQVGRRRNVHDFYAAAIDAGGRPQIRPGRLRRHDSRFGASVFDLDSNIVQVIECDEDDHSDRGSASAYMSTSRSDVSRATMSHTSRTSKRSKHGSVVSHSTSTSGRSIQGESAKQLQLQRTASVSTSTMSAADDVLRFLRKSMATGRGHHAVSSKQPIEVCPKALAGAFIGAAAGAAVAYAACKSEKSSARAEYEASAAAMRLMQTRQSTDPCRSRAASQTSRGIALPSDRVECVLAPLVLDPVVPSSHAGRTFIPSTVKLSTTSVRTGHRAPPQAVPSPRATSSRSSVFSEEHRGRSKRRSSSRAASRGPPHLNHGSGFSSKRLPPNQRRHTEPNFGGYHLSAPRYDDDDTIVPEDSVSNVGLYPRRRPTMAYRYSMPVRPTPYANHGQPMTTSYVDQDYGRPRMTSLPYHHRAYSSI